MQACCARLEPPSVRLRVRSAFDASSPPPPWRSPDAIRGGKRLLNLAAEADQHAILLAESKEQGALIGSANQVEAVMSNLQKREAQYAD